MIIRFVRGLGAVHSSCSYWFPVNSEVRQQVSRPRPWQCLRWSKGDCIVLHLTSLSRL
jgi:hypothetical protein